MLVFVFGNIDLEFDSLPIKILPELKKRFSNIRFVIKDPNELGIPTQNKLVIIDTVDNIKNVSLINLNKIKQDKSCISVHDFDLCSYLSLIKKIKKDIDIVIIGIPMSYNKQKAIKQTINLLSGLVLENEKRSSYKDHKHV